MQSLATAMGKLPEEEEEVMGEEKKEKDDEDDVGDDWGLVRLTAGWRALSRLHHLLPLSPRTSLPSHKVDRPHVVQPSIPVITGKYPQLPIIDCRSVSASGHWLSTRWHPLRPLPSGELVLPKVIPTRDK